MRIIIPLLSTLLPVVPSLLIVSLNVKKSVRYKQMRFPGLAILFSAVCCVLFSRISKFASDILSFPLIREITDLIAPAGKIEYITLVYSAVIMNALLLFAFFFVKGAAAIGAGKKVMPKNPHETKGFEAIYWKIADIFYDIGGGTGNVQRMWVPAMNTLNYAARITQAAYLLLLVLLQIPVFTDRIPYELLSAFVKTVYFLPAVTLIPLNEIRWFLDGKEEIAVKHGGMLFDRAETAIKTDYAELCEQYKKQFPERFSACITAEAKGGATNFHNDIKTESNFENAVKNHIVGRGFTVNENYMNCIRHIYGGENVLVDTSVFSEFGEYLFVYLNVLLARGDNILFLCPDNESTETVSGYIKKKFTELNGYHPIWIIRDGTAANESGDADVLVVTPQFICSESGFIGQEKFFTGFNTVVMLRASEAIVRNSLLLTLLIHKISRKKKADGSGKPRYICLSDGIPPDTHSALKQILDLQEDMVQCSGYRSSENTCLMLWNYEPSDASGTRAPAQDNLFGENDSQMYWGAALPLACVGLKYNAGPISVITRSSGPYIQRLNSMKNQSHRLNGYFGSLIEFDKNIEFNGYDGERDAAFIIADDELYNLPLAVYNNCRFGGKSASMIHIISKPYMLRDFFAANAGKYIGSEANINMIIPVYADTAMIAMIKILCELSEQGMSEEDLTAEIKTACPSAGNVGRVLEACLEAALCDRRDPVEYHFRFAQKSVFNSEKAEFDQKQFVYLREVLPLDRILQSSKQAMIELRGVRHTIDICRDRIYQHYLPDQTLVFRGTLYKINAIESEEGVLHVTEAADRLLSPVDYIQTKTYTLTGKPEKTWSVPVAVGVGDGIFSGYEVALYRQVSLRAETTGYFAPDAVSPRIDLIRCPEPKPLSSEERKAAERKYTDARMISLKFTGIAPEKADRTAFLLAVIFSELMKTLFPYFFQCTAVCPVLTDGEAIYGGVMGGRIGKAYPQIQTGGYLERDPGDAEVLIIEDCASNTGVIQALLHDTQNPLYMLFDITEKYLAWFATFEDTGNISKKYLYFGSGSCPECFDFETLTGIFNGLGTFKRGKAVKVDSVSSKGHCSYCGSDLISVQYTEIKDKAGKNNRKLCRKCAKIIVRDESALESLYEKTRNYLCETFGISLPADIGVRFASAENIRKRMKTGDRRVVTGFADPRKRELWVETDAPETNIMGVLAHELTHFWQFDHIGKADRVYTEGHASYVEVQYLRHENHAAFAEKLGSDLNGRQDEYGTGFRLISKELEKRGDGNSFAYMAELFGTNPDAGKG